MTNPSRPSRFGKLRELKERGDVPLNEPEGALLGTEETPEPDDASVSGPEMPAVAPQIAQDAANRRPRGNAQATRQRPQRGAQTADAEPEGRGRVGRPPGKRSDEAFRQVSAIVRRDTYRATRRRLLDEEREFSQLIQVLLDRWLKGDIRT